MKDLHKKTAPYIIEIVSKLKAAGYETYIVGGAVRDFLLQREPKDYDISTSATPEEVKKVFRDKRCIIIGRRFRLVHLYVSGNEIVEISTFRKMPDQEDQVLIHGNHAQKPEHMIFNDNEFGSSYDDAHRRDFTVNALFYDPVDDQVVDHTGMGMADLSAGLVRSIGDPALRFEEDPVRILRALKLVGQYGFTLEENTEKALFRCMPMILHASISRLTLELEKILKNPYGDAIIMAFRKYGFLQYFLPEIDRMFDTPQGKYLMELFSKRNERIRAGRYRSSLSLAIALFTLPFLEKKSGRLPGQLWSPVEDPYDSLRDLILQVMTPHTITRRDGAHAISSLLLQMDLRNLENLAKVLYSSAYPNARELASIQNELVWHMPDFEEQCPRRTNLNFLPKRKRSNRRRRNGRNHNNRGNTGSGTSDTAAE